MQTKSHFIIIGAAKSGTTTLYKYLCRHPQVYMSTPKEPDFFSIDKNYDRGLDWYKSLFEEAKPGQVCGEASTTYSRLHQHPQTAERIAQALPNIKLIYILRHPVDRAYSFYIHRFKGARHKPELAVPKTFEETIEAFSEFVDSSDYMFQIEKYLRLFPKESFLFLLTEDLRQNPVEVMTSICRFIGVDDSRNLVGEQEIVANQASYYPEWFVRKELTSSLRAMPGVSFASALFPSQMRESIYKIWRSWKYKQWLEEQYFPPPMLPDTRRKLIERFYEPNQKLSRFLEKDLSHWSK